MKKKLLILTLIISFVSCQIKSSKEKDQELIIGYEFNAKGDKLNIISGDVGITDIWIDYIQAHNQRNLDKIAEIDSDDIEVYRADGTVGKGVKTHVDVLKNWFETSNPSWKVIWMVTNSVQKKDGSIEHWLTTGNEFTDTVDGNEIFMNVVADVNFEKGKIKRINIHNRAKEKK